MAVDVSKIPNNSKFDPVREAILKLQKDVQEGVSGVATVNSSDGNIIITNSGNITVGTVGETITIGINDSSYLTEEVNDLTSAVTWANVPDANITQSSVTQHQAALSITENQISDLGSYIELTDLSVTTSATPSAGGALSYDDTTGVFTFTPADAGTGLTLQQVTANGNTTTYGISTGNISVQPAGTGNGVVAISANSVGNASVTLTPGSTAGDGVISTTIERAISFRPFNTEKVVIASDGNMNVYEKLAVGKTTAAASYHLEVDGTALAHNFITSMTASGTTYTGTVSQYYNALQIRTATGGTISLGGSGPLSVQNNVAIKDGNLDVNGDVTADNFIGDGSQLTNLPAGDLDLQDVTDNGATTTNSISIDGNLSILDTHSLYLFDENGAKVNIDARGDGTGAMLHKWNRNSDDTAYLAYYENWYDGSSYHQIGIESNTWRIGTRGGDGVLYVGDLDASTNGALDANKQGIVIQGTGGQADAAQDGTERLPTLQFFDSVGNYGSNTATAGELRGGVEWYTSETSSNFPAISGAIYSVNENTYNTQMGLGFYTNYNGTTPTEKLRIGGAGEVNIVSGNLQIGGTTVIDSSRAASFQTLQVAGSSNLSGAVTIDTGSSSSDALVIRGDSPTINFIDDNSSSSDDFYIHVNSNNFYVLRDVSGSNTIGTGWDAPHPLQLEGDTNIGYLFGSRMFADNYHPNADKWTSARTITLGGDLTGSVSIDGSSNVTLSAQIVNDSHTHDDRYYTESEIQQFFDRGYLNSHSASNLAVGWYTIATNTGDRALGEFQIWDTASSDHQSVLFNASHHFGNNNSNDITVLANSRFSGTNFRYIRIKDAGTYDGAALQVYVDGSSNSVYAAIVGGNAQASGWVLKDWVPDATDPGDLSNYSSFGVRCQVDLDLVISGGIITTGEIYSGGETSQFRVLNTGDEGSGNGLDADTVDGLQASQFLRSDANDTATGNYTFDGNVYIDTNTGSNALYVTRSGATSQALKMFTDDATCYLEAVQDENTGQYGSVQIALDAGGTDNFFSVTDGVNGTARLFISNNGNGGYFNSGNFGINNTSPSAKLHVKDSVEEVVRIESGTTGSIHFFQGSTRRGILGYSNGTSIGSAADAGDMILRAESSNKLHLATGSAVAMSVDTSQRIGIGTTSPSYKLHVAGEAQLGYINFEYSSNYAGVRWKDASQNLAWKIGNDTPSGNHLYLYDYAKSGSAFTFKPNSDMCFTPTGNVGIGTTSPDYKLQVNDNIYTALGLYSDYSYSGNRNWAWRLNTFGSGNWGGIGLWQSSSAGTNPSSGQVRFGIDQSGNVGIGTTSPSYPLDVTGRARITDDLFLGDILYHNGDTNTYMQFSSDRVRFYAGGLKMLDMIEGSIDRVRMPTDVSISQDTDPAYALDVGGTIRATGDVIAYSDARVKENVHTIDNALDKVTKLRGVSYNKIGETEEKIGVIAQEIEKVLPQVVQEDDEGMKSVAYGNIVGVLIEAIKEQQKQIDELKARLDGSTY